LPSVIITIKAIGSITAETTDAERGGEMCGMGELTTWLLLVA
jgi:hypothetical protein